MNNYKFIKQKAFEKMDKFEKRVNESTTQGWRINGFSSDHGSITVLLERER
ncbi:MAG: hypothetical protein ABJG47_01885 [Ekhidna sp.]